MIEKSSAVYLLFHTFILIAGQQTFERKGDHYIAKLAIHREKPHSFDAQMKAPSQQIFRTNDHSHQRRPWRQNDRITKQEVVQNLARALLSHKKPKNEIQNEIRQENKEKLIEYALYQARMAESKQMQVQSDLPPPKPLPPPPNLVPAI